MKTATLTESVTPTARPLALATLAVSLLVVAVGLIADPVHGWTGVLVGGMFGMSIAMGVALFAGINLVAGARWWDPLRPLSIGVAKTLPVALIAILLTAVLGLGTLYPWARPGAAEASHLIHEKVAWLNAPFFLARAVIVAVVWLVLIRRLGLASGVLPVRSGAARPSAAGTGASFLVVFAGTISVAYWDWTMSLEPEWFSTMYGVYGFAGTFQAGLAALAVLAVRVKLTDDQRHCLGKLLFGFSMFWAYIWFCQYMLIWYADLPEEAIHYNARLAGGWSSLFWLNPIVCFVVPFLLLLAAGPKKRPVFVAQVALLVLLGRWIDTFLLAAPPAGPLQNFPIYAVAATLAVVLGMKLSFDRLATNLHYPAK